MEKQKFIENVKSQFIDVENVEFTAETIFRNIETYDSLTGMSILVMLQDQYNITIADDDYKKLSTIEDIYNYVKERCK